MTRRRRASVYGVALVVLIVAAGWLARGWFERRGNAVAQAAVDAAIAPSPATAADPAAAPGASDAAGPRSKPLHDDQREVSETQRLDAIARAQVWRTPSVPINQVDLRGNPVPHRELTCKFQITELGGTTPKFDCELETGELIRIKYGKGPEIPAEVAATRLLRALGFGADDVVSVERLRCYGCPEEPFSTMKAIEITRTTPLYKQVTNYDTFEDFDWVALEQKFDARPIETKKFEGWAFFELDKIDPSKGGAPRAHVDALRLMAVFLAHWDNKTENQRLVCLERNWPAGTPCPEPFLLLQDVGATFGPSKVDLPAWEEVRIWQDRATCTVSMRDLPYNGATFSETRVSEAGRQFLGKMLAQLSERQLTDLFAGARFDQKRGVFTAAYPLSEWVRVFKAKVQSISEGAPCPTT
jgi:hypothetical protein